MSRGFAQGRVGVIPQPGAGGESDREQKSGDQSQRGPLQPGPSRQAVGHRGFGLGTEVFRAMKNLRCPLRSASGCANSLGCQPFAIGIRLQVLVQGSIGTDPEFA